MPLSVPYREVHPPSGKAWIKSFRHIVPGAIFFILVACKPVAPRPAPAVPAESPTAAAAEPEKPAAQPERLHVVSVATPMGPDKRSAPGAKMVPVEEEKTLLVPPTVAAFQDWLARYKAGSASERKDLESEGKNLAAARLAAMSAMLASDPEAAILLTPTPVEREMLPAGVRDSLEQIVSGEGFYGVKAVCNHEPGVDHAAACRIEHEVFLEGVSYRASIYGRRTQRLTEESASIYGVARDGVLALHQDDVVVLPAGAVNAMAPSDQLALIHRGKTTLVPAADLAARVQSLLLP